MQTLADLVLFIHAAFVAFVVLGQVVILLGWWRGWRWTRKMSFRVAHLAAIGYVVLESWIGIACPLTVLENTLRRAAGEAGYAGSFIADWLSRLLYWSAPPWIFTLVYTLFGVLVAVTYWKYPPRRRNAK